jgi:ribosome-associated toxin RatA of RatAB toxin-antitoxin module
MERSVIIMTMLAAGMLWSLCESSSVVDFPDHVGPLADSGSDYRIRLIETEKDGPKTAEARFLVKSSRQACWNVITDYAHYPEFMPNVKKSALVVQGGDSALWSFSFKVALWTVDYTIDLKNRQPRDSVWTIVWTYVKGDLKSTTGSWRLTECKDNPGFVLAEYSVRVDVGKFVPQWVSTMMTTRSIPGLIEAVRKRAAAQGG